MRVIRKENKKGVRICELSYGETFKTVDNSAIFFMKTDGKRNGEASCVTLHDGCTVGFADSVVVFPAKIEAREVE